MTALSKPKKAAKSERERKVLLALVDYYIKTGRPVGSNTLKEAEFEELSAATIRNYFAHLEEEGYLKQQHSSGGRIPTNKSIRLYIKENLDSTEIDESLKNKFQDLSLVETKEIVAQSEKMVEELSQATNLAAFISAPRFDHDSILDVKIVPIDPSRLLALLITDFGTVHTEILHVEEPVHTFGAKRLEAYLHARLHNLPKPDNLEPLEEELAQKFYNEVMVRYLVGYSHFTDNDIFKTGFSKLLHYPEFHDPFTLSSSLSLFENTHGMRLLLKDCLKHNALKVWIGEDLNSYTEKTPDLSLIAIPYYIHRKPVGAIGLLGPTRLPYKDLFGIVRQFSDSISRMLTNNIYTFKIAVREPGKNSILLEQPQVKLLEVKK